MPLKENIYLVDLGLKERNQHNRIAEIYPIDEKALKEHKSFCDKLFETSEEDFIEQQH